MCLTTLDLDDDLAPQAGSLFLFSFHHLKILHYRISFAYAIHGPPCTVHEQSYNVYYVQLSTSMLNAIVLP